jgi:hypothetical protein
VEYDAKWDYLKKEVLTVEASRKLEDSGKDEKGVLRRNKVLLGVKMLIIGVLYTIVSLLWIRVILLANYTRASPNS